MQLTVTRRGAMSLRTAHCPLPPLHPFQLNRIRLIRIPLTDINIFILINADIVAMLENGLILKHQLQLAVDIVGRGSARVGNHLVVFIQDGDKAGIWRSI